MKNTTLILCSALLLAQVSRAERLTFNDQASWDSWDTPFGLIVSGDNGQLQLKKFAKDVNVIADAADFSYMSVTRDVVSGGVWEALSNPTTGGLVIDGDPNTYWQPNSEDAVEDWAIEIDLGRAVLAKEIRLRFPDQEGAKPLRQFTVYTATGLLIATKEDLFRYDPVFRTTKPNTETLITIPLSYANKDSALVLDADLEIDHNDLNQYKLFQRIRILVEEKNADAALAEIEIVGIGDNISLGTLQRGGVTAGFGVAGPEFLFDGNMNTSNLVTGLGGGGGSISGWEEAGLWFGVDLGAVFYIDDMFVYSFSPDEGQLGFGVNGLAGSGHEILFSGGQQSLQTTLPGPQSLDYDALLFHDAPNGDGLAYLRYRFAPRKIRYLFWRGLHVGGWGWSTKWGELMLFSPGYPAEVSMQSSFIDLGAEAGDGRPKVIKALHWDADLPVGTRIELRSRSGNSLAAVYTFYDRKNEAVTEEKWNSSPKVLRGPIDTSLVVGEDWGGWSNDYNISGEPFKSDSPRRFVQLEMILSTDDPQSAAAVNELSIEFEEALVQGARGSIVPRTARPNEDTRFTYTLWPQMEAEDSGFDMLRFTVPAQVEAGSIELSIAGQPISPSEISQVGDSLLVRLPAAVLEDSVQVSFTTHLLENATVFPLDLGQSERPGLWQSVEPAERRSNLVMLPDLPGGHLIGDLSFSSSVLTPNSDGVHDELQIDFVMFKVTGTEPQVDIYDLAGRRVAGLEPTATGQQRQYTWDGLDSTGNTVTPGIYFLRVDLGADAGDDKALRTIAVAY